MRSFIPVENPSNSYWLHNLPSVGSEDSTALPTSSDVVIIGCGLSGASTAFHLSQFAKSFNIVVIDARGISECATGRNGGLLWPGIDANWDELKSKYGFEGAKKVFTLELDNVDAIFECAGRNPDAGLALDRYPEGGIVPYNTEQEFQEAVKELEAMVADGVGVGHYDLLDKLHMDRFFGQGHKYAGAIRTRTVYRFWPAAFVVSLAKEAISRGVQIFTNTLVNSVDDLSDGLFKINTTKGAITTKHVVYATNAYTKSILPSAPIQPVRNHVVLSKPVSKQSLPEFAFSAEDGYIYCTPRGDGRILIGGARHVVEGMEVGVVSDRTEDHVLLATDTLKDYLRTIPGLESAEFDWEWSGILGFTKDRFPLVGPVPGCRNKWILAGFSGHGMPRTLFAGKSIACRILGDEDGAREATCPAFAADRFAWD